MFIYYATLRNWSDDSGDLEMTMYLGLFWPGRNIYKRINKAYVLVREGNFQILSDPVNTHQFLIYFKNV